MVVSFAAMCLAGNAKEICDMLPGRMQDTAVGAWIERCWYWCGRNATDSLCHYWDTNISFVCWFQEVGYE